MLKGIVITLLGYTDQKLTFRILMKSERDQILVPERNSGDRMLPILSDIRNNIPATKITRTILSQHCATIISDQNTKHAVIGASGTKPTHMISKTLPSAVHTGFSKGVNVSLHQETHFTRFIRELDRTQILRKLPKRRRSREEKEEEGERTRNSRRGGA